MIFDFHHIDIAKLRDSNAPTPAAITFALQAFDHDVMPIVINTRKQVICGHKRLREARQKGEMSVSVVRETAVRRMAKIVPVLSAEQVRQLYQKARRPLRGRITIPRAKYTEATIANCVEALEQVGFQVPLLVSERGRVICGGEFLAAAARIRALTVPVIEPWKLTPHEEEFYAGLRAYNVSSKANMPARQRSKP